MSDSAATVPERGSAPSVTAGFMAFYEREFTAATRFAWLLVRSSAVAEDLAQEAFVALYRADDQVTTREGSCIESS